MRALTLTQPWATLVAIGAKRIETRSWRTSHRGQLAIHAAKGFPKSARAICSDLYFRDALAGELLPTSVILCTCRIIDCVPTTTVRILYPDVITEREQEFGDYSAGRWAWILGDVQKLPEPVPAKGALSLWEWDSATQGE